MTREEMIIEAQKMRKPRTREIIGEHDFDAVTTCEETYIETEMGKSHVYIIRPKDGEGRKPAFLNLHGGGFIRPHGARDISFCREIAYLTNSVAFSLDYRLAPEYPYPVAIDEEEAVLRYMAKHAEELGILEDKIALVGQSSGGNNAAVLAMRLKNDPEIKLSCCICTYFPTDISVDAAEKTPDLDQRRLEMSRLYNDSYVEAGEQRKNPEVSPLYATPEMLSGMPRMILMPAAKDDLFAEDMAYAKHLGEAGVVVEVKVFANSNHGFVINQNGEWRKGRAFIAYKLLEVFEQ